MFSLGRALIFSVGTLAFFLLFSSLQLIPFKEPSFTLRSIQTQKYSLNEIEQAEKIEHFLKRKVPGLVHSYSDIFNLITREGHHVWLTGGAIRDLLGSDGDQPKDIDFAYDCTSEEIQKILIRNDIFYTRILGGIATLIGSKEGPYLEGVESRYSFNAKEYELEFTVNSVHYHLNTATFEPRFKRGIKDLEEKKLVVETDNLNQWLYGTLNPLDPLIEPSYKIFRFWKMRGKGYRGSTHLEHFIVLEALRSFKKDPILFKQCLIRYLGKHFSSFDQIEKGCALTMGSRWCAENFHSLYFEAKALDQKIEALWNNQRNKNHLVKNKERTADCEELRFRSSLKDCLLLDPKSDIRPLSKLRVRQFSGLFWPLFDSNYRGNRPLLKLRF